MCKLILYLLSAEVMENGFSVIVEARGLQWATVKLILRTVQEALPAQIHAAYILCPAPFLQKRQILTGVSKEKSKLEFTVSVLVLREVDRFYASAALPDSPLLSRPLTN